MTNRTLPPDRQGLYDPAFERDACGVGFVANLRGVKSHTIVRQAFEVLRNLSHRGACGSEVNTGDGAGILLQIPDAFYRRECAGLGIKLPPAGHYGTGLFFLPRDFYQRKLCEEIVEQTVRSEGQVFLGWRDVPADNSMIGKTARDAEPVIRQAFIGRGPGIADDLAWERKLYVIRKSAVNSVHAGGVHGRQNYYVCSLSSRTIVYKGMFSAEQVESYFPDLTDPAVDSALALVHSRFSTNTFPSWERAHPYRYIAHNGEINTLRGNINAMKSREALFRCAAIDPEIAKILPIVDEEGSDSAIFDNVLELLVLAGRGLPHAMMMLIPEAWSGHETMTPARKAFYEFHSFLMEPWDGPASVVFTDGQVIGATLDRNGLRPSRYYVTHDDVVVMASEVGVLPEIAPESVKLKGRLQPGRMFLVDLAAGRIVDDNELKEKLAAATPYRQWLDANMVKLEDLPEPPPPPLADHSTITRRQLAFGYTQEDVRFLMQPMAENGEEAIGSMGSDTPLAVLSERPQLLYSYFKQLFAQVTNPPLDAIREELVTSMEISVGPEANLLDPGPASARQIKLKTPILSNEDIARLRNARLQGFRAADIATHFPAAEGPGGLEKAMERICAEAVAAVKGGAAVLILTDRGVDENNVAVPALLATAGVHHHLIRAGLRGHCGLVVETGEAREIHHFCCLIGYGAGGVNPYLAFETFDDLIRRGCLAPGLDHAKAVKNYIKAAAKGVLKVLSKMGISTVQSYRGAQIFEAVGISRKVLDKWFTNTPGRLDGIGLDIIASESLQRHAKAYPPRGTASPLDLDSGGQYQYRRDGEYHMFNPETVHKLQYAVRKGDYSVYKEYSSALLEDGKSRLATLRGLFGFRWADKPVPLSEVEPASEIVKRFTTGAMSFGAISAEAHETLAVAMNRLGGKSNSGEGGEDEVRFRRDTNGDLRRSAVKQVASGRFGVTSSFLVNADEIQIKIAQGAKPGEGGQLPGKKVYPWIARVRLSTPGVGLISPPPHHDIYSIEDLAQLIHDLKNSNPAARINVKLVAEVGVGTIAAGVAKAHADVIMISGHDGGTGASPLTSLKHAGLPWELGLSEAHQVLVLNRLRGRVRLQTDGQMKTGRDVIVAALLGAEEYGFATAALIAEGCIMMRVCHLDTCPVGIATQNPALRKLFPGRPEHVVNFMLFVAEETRELMAKMGFRTIDEMIGRTDRLSVREVPGHPKVGTLDLGPVLAKPDVEASVPRRCVEEQDHGLDGALDRRLIALCRESLESGRPTRLILPIRNVNRTAGTMLGSEVTRRWGSRGLPDDTIRIRFQGAAGNSFAAFLPRGINLLLEGDANDYVGKGLSGGRVAVFPPRCVGFDPARNIVIGNVALYGATSGEAYFRGVAGERFAVRNSGANAVVEGVGDHGCEYMTGGRVVVLGATGRNFAAGMSGGVAWVLDEAGDFRVRRVNRGMVDPDMVPDADDLDELRSLISRHLAATGSTRAAAVLEDWDRWAPKFVMVVPVDFKNAWKEQKKARKELGTAAAAG